MASRTCRSCRNLLRRQLRPLRDAPHAPVSRIIASQTLGHQRRLLHQSPRCSEAEKQPSLIARAVRKWAAPTAHSYAVYGATESIYEACASQAAYSISEADRKSGKIEVLEDGEEIGVGGGMWHNDFKLLPTFSTWSQVTMLHMYLIVVRLRCFEKEEWQQWQNQLVNHFFNNAEERMDLVHGIESRMIRQRYLRDLFTTWRGVILAYDEGLVKGDAVLASAVWRNIFKGSEDIDLRHLAAIVSWMRQCLKNLDQMQDTALLYHAASVFKWPATSELPFVDRPVKELDGILSDKLVANATTTA